MNKLIKEALEKEAKRLENPGLLERAEKLKEQVTQLQAMIESLENSDKAIKAKIKTIKDFIK